VELREMTQNVKIPNERTIETIEKSERGKELHEASTVQEMFKELDS
jgi:antitoxin component of RelBE/YafQ-DinJ toxin-antitoxin module